MLGIIPLHLVDVKSLTTLDGGFDDEFARTGWELARQGRDIWVKLKSEIFVPDRSSDKLL